jgi:hypothetical protein
MAVDLFFSPHYYVALYALIHHDFVFFLTSRCSTPARKHRSNAGAINKVPVIEVEGRNGGLRRRYAVSTPYEYISCLLALDLINACSTVNSALLQKPH